MNKLSITFISHKQNKKRREKTIKVSSPKKGLKGPDLERSNEKTNLFKFHSRDLQKQYLPAFVSYSFNLNTLFDKKLFLNFKEIITWDPFLVAYPFQTSSFIVFKERKVMKKLRKTKKLLKYFVLAERDD